MFQCLFCQGKCLIMKGFSSVMPVAGFLFSQYLIAFIIPCVGKFIYKSFMSMVIILVFSFIFMFVSSVTTSCEFFALYMFGKLSKLCNFLFICFAILYGGAGVLSITGLIGLYSLCVLICTFNLGAVGYIFIRNFCVFFSIIRLLF